MTTLLEVGTAWTVLSSATNVTFQVTNLQASGAKVLVVAAAAAHAAGSALGFTYCAGQGELAKPVAAFGTGTTLYTRTTHGVAGVTVHDWS